MPRFFFNLNDGCDTPDQEGTELANWEQAQREALAVAGAVISDNARLSKLCTEWSMEVTNEVGLLLFRLGFYMSASPVLTASSKGPSLSS